MKTNFQATFQLQTSFTQLLTNLLYTSRLFLALNRFAAIKLVCKTKYDMISTASIAAKYSTNSPVVPGKDQFHRQSSALYNMF